MCMRVCDFSLSADSILFFCHVLSLLRPNRSELTGSVGWVRKGPRVGISTITVLYVDTMPTRLSALTENYILYCSNLSAKSIC